ncbi:uncharacterized protein si:dkey-191c17.2 [Pristis pectinata]|uniref:uncharacterized protein si:dkey-191c17.2 n=1 Tax=Pristis pectinata TaxID=685728 RepID=UPI00223CEEE2|nr:uncharacterized protein si:dkey-191c17.2 [Pristis pectinata]
MHRVRVKQTYWLDEESEIKLQQLGAVLIDDVIVKDDYYDNDTFDLATNQIWLSQRDLQWQLIIALPKSNINGDGGKQGEQNSLVPKSEATTKSRSQHRDGPSSEERYGSSPRLRSWNSEGDASGKQNKVVGEGNPLQEHKTATDPEQWDKTTSTDVHDKAEPRYNELRAHRQIIEYIAQFLQISLSKEEGGDMMLSHFLQLAKIHHYASCHTAKRRTYKLKDTCRIVIEKDELMPRCLAIMSVDADVLNIINELEKMEEIAAHLRMDPCQTDPILA